MSKRAVEVEFIAVATVEVDVEELDSEEYDLSHPDELKQAIQDWATDNVMPEVVHSDYSGDYAQIMIRDLKCQMCVVDRTEIRVLGEDR